MSDEKVYCTECEKGTRFVLHRGTNELHRITCPCQKQLPIKFVFQDYPKSCMAACVAMIAGRTESEIVRNYYGFAHDFTENGSYLSDATQILDKHFGFAYQTRYQHYAPLGSHRPEWPMKTWAPIHLCEVTNLRDSGKHGVVLLPDGRVLDPAAGVIQGLHRYPSVETMTGFWKVG